MALGQRGLQLIVVLGTSSLEDVDQLLRVPDDEIKLQEPLFDLRPALLLVASVLLYVRVCRPQRLPRSTSPPPLKWGHDSLRLPLPFGGRVGFSLGGLRFEAHCFGEN